MVEITVVVGRATVVATKLPPKVIALAVALSVNLNSIKSPSTGVPDKFVVIEVMAVARPVKFIISTLSVFVVGVAPGALVVVSLLVTLLLVTVCVAVRPAIVCVVEGKVITVESVPERVSVLVTANVFALVSVRIPVEAVIVNPLIEVAVATPKTGVINVGEVESTTATVPVEAATPVPPLATGSVPVTSVVKANCAHADVPVPVPLKTRLLTGVEEPMPIFDS